MLNLKGFLCGGVTFVVLNIIYIAFQLKRIGVPLIQPAARAVGVDVRIYAIWTVLNPMWWIILMVLMSVCSLFFGF